MQSLFNAVVAFEAIHWQAQLAWLLTALPSIIVAATPYPKVSAFLKKASWFLNLFSVLTHKDSPNTIKPPLTQSKPPVVLGQTVTATITATTSVPALMILGALFALSPLGGCATLNWTTPVAYAGPAAGVEEVSKGSAPGVAGGFQATIGLGQFDFQGHEFDIFDPGLLVLGGLAPGGSGPSGMLQLGGKLGFLSGIIGAGVLFDCIDSAGQGVCQGGPGSGPIYAGIFDVQAIVSYFQSVTPPVGVSLAQEPRLPRGGL